MQYDKNETIPRLSYHSGFYEKENDGQRDFRWMQAVGEVMLSGLGGAIEYISMTLATPHDTVLAISTKHVEQRIELAAGWQTRIIALKAALRTGEILRLCAPVQDIAHDTRCLSLMIADIYPVSHENVPPILYEHGFYAPEHDGLREFRWMKPVASIRVTSSVQPGQYLLMEVGLHHKGSTIDFHIQYGHAKKTIKLIPDWQIIGIPLDDFDAQHPTVLMRCDHREAANGDDRELSVMVSNIRVDFPNTFEQNSIKMHASISRGIVCDTRAWLFVCDTSAVCNLRCAYCALDKDLRKHPDMPKGIEKTKPIIVDYLPYTSKIQPFTSGEPFAREDMWNVLRENEKSLFLYPTRKIEFSTNGLLLHPAMIQRIMDSHINSLLISVNAATEKTFRRIQGGDFHLLLTNIKNLVMAKKKYRKSSLAISLSYVLMRENIQELPDFIRMANEIGVPVVQFWPLGDYAMGLPPRKMDGEFTFYYRQQNLMYYPQLTKRTLDMAKDLAQSLNVAISDTTCYRFELEHVEDIPYPLPIEQFDALVHQHQDLYSVNAQGERKIFDMQKYKQCYLPWVAFYLATDGTFAPCVHILYNGGVGNALNEGVMGVWNNAQMQEIRRNIIDGKVNPACRNAHCPFI